MDFCSWSGMPSGGTYRLWLQFVRWPLISSTLYLSWNMTGLWIASLSLCSCRKHVLPYVMSKCMGTTFLTLIHCSYWTSYNLYLLADCNLSASDGKNPPPCDYLTEMLPHLVMLGQTYSILKYSPMVSISHLIFHLFAWSEHSCLSALNWPIFLWVFGTRLQSFLLCYVPFLGLQLCPEI